MINNFIRLFHIFIITLFAISVSGCGYKADPVYKEKSQVKESRKIYDV